MLSSGVWRIEADPNALENALLNLAVNARDAMDGRGTIRIAVATRRGATVGPQLLIAVATTPGTGRS